LAAGHVVVAGLLVTPVFVVVLHRLGIPAVQLLRFCLRPALGGVVMGLVAFGLHKMFGGGFVGLTVAGLGGCAAYVPFVLPIVTRLRAKAPGTENAAAEDTDERPLAASAAESA